jgi:hypothetical protein
MWAKNRPPGTRWEQLAASSPIGLILLQSPAENLLLAGAGCQLKCGEDDVGLVVTLLCIVSYQQSTCFFIS